MKYFFLLCLLFIIIGATGQKRADIGIILGGSYYLGDINTSRQFYRLQPGVGAIYRHNFHSRYALRASLWGSTLAGSDRDFSYEYQQLRNKSFSTQFIDFTAQIEFNFFPYEIGDKDDWHSPYVAAGGTFVLAPSTEAPYQPALAMAVGYKVNISERVGMGIEYAFRKTFTDQLDNLAGVKNLPDGQALNSNDLTYFKQYAYRHDNDWYSNIGIFVSYKFIKPGKCPAYD